MTPHETTIPSELSADISAGIAGTLFRVPPRLNDIELKHIKAGNIEKVLDRQVRQLRRVMASADDHGKQLRRAAALFLKASVTRDFELAITYAFMCLEGILLEPNKTENVLSRLVEAVAYRIGTSQGHRRELRQELRNLYDVRSRYVHTGTPGVARLADVRRRCLMIVNEVLSREILDLTT
jgi:hypothetical protein